MCLRERESYKKWRSANINSNKYIKKVFTLHYNITIDENIGIPDPDPSDLGRNSTGKRERHKCHAVQSEDSWRILLLVILILYMDPSLADLRSQEQDRSHSHASTAREICNIGRIQQVLQHLALDDQEQDGGYHPSQDSFQSF